MEWEWTLGGGEEARPVRCRENDCYYHDGRACRFPWIERPPEAVLDRGLCRNFLIEEGDVWLARIHSVH